MKHVGTDMSKRLADYGLSWQLWRRVAETMLKEVVETGCTLCLRHPRKHVLLASLCFFSLGFPSKLCLTSCSFWVISLSPKVKGKKKLVFFFNDFCRKNKWLMRVEAWTIVFLCTDVFILNFPGRWCERSVHGTQGWARQARHWEWHLLKRCASPSSQAYGESGSPGSSPTSAADSSGIAPTGNCVLPCNVVAGAWKIQDHKGHGDFTFLYK